MKRILHHPHTVSKTRLPLQQHRLRVGQSHCFRLPNDELVYEAFHPHLIPRLKVTWCYGKCVSNFEPQEKGSNSLLASSSDAPRLPIALTPPHKAPCCDNNRIEVHVFPKTIISEQWLSAYFSFLRWKNQLYCFSKYKGWPKANFSSPPPLEKNSTPPFLITSSPTS